MDSFAIGNLAVYHGKGVGLITGLQTTDPRGNSCRICKLELKKSSAQVRVDHPSQSTVRQVMNNEQLDNVYQILRTQDIKPNKTTWNRRYRGYLQNIGSGEPELIAGVLRDLELLGISKSLSFGESKIYAEAKELIVEEGAYTLIIPEMEHFLRPFNHVKGHALLQNLKGVLEKCLKDNKFELSAKGMKDISALTLTLPTYTTDDDYMFTDLFNAVTEGLAEIQKDANKIIARNARKAVNAAHKPNKDTEINDASFEILTPWKNIPLVGILEPKKLGTDKFYESLKNLFIDKGTEGLDDLDMEGIIEPLVKFANHHIILQLHDLLSNLDLKRERKRRPRAKPKPIVRKSLRKKEPELEAPKVLQESLTDIETLVKTFKPTVYPVSTFEDVVENVQQCFLELDTEIRMHALDVTKVYLEENLDQFRDEISQQLDNIFEAAREKGRKEKEEKNKNKKKSKSADGDDDSSDSEEDS